MARKRVFHQQLVFDANVPGCFRPLTRQEIQQDRLPKPPPVDIFRNDPQEKLWRIQSLPDPGGYLSLALEAVRHFFYGSQEGSNPFVQKNLYRMRYVDTYRAAPIPVVVFGNMYSSKEHNWLRCGAI